MGTIRKRSPVGEPLVSDRSMSDEQQHFAIILGRILANRWHEECRIVRSESLQDSLETNQDVTTGDDRRSIKSKRGRKPGKRR